jgi:hypothetical protein
MRLDHPIFQGPMRPQIELVSLPTPGGYRNWAGGKELPAKLPMWTVQSGDLGKSVDYGLVSDPVGFEDSPDAEWISGGVNSKGPNSMAIGRHGNWFLWGFAGDPTQMTESARCVFVNAIVWMKQFDGKPPLQPLDLRVTRAPGRDSIFNSIEFLRAYAGRKEMSDYLRGLFPADLFKETEGDPDRLLDFYREHVEFLSCVKVHRKVELDGGQSTEFDAQVLELDPALADLGVSNRKLELFETIADLFEDRGATDATATELCDRYLPKDAPREPKALREWVAKHRDRLYFSDVYGYRWFVAPADLPARPTVPSAAAAARPAEAGGGG